MPDVRESISETQSEPEAKPRCPNCGWRDVRISRPKNAVDQVLSALRLQAYRCRSCNTRFRRYRRNAGAPTG